MRTRRGGGASEPKEQAVRRGGVRKPAAKKASGAVVTKRIQLRGRGSSRAEAAGGSNEDELAGAEAEEAALEPRQQHEQQQQQPAQQPGEGAQLQPASRKRKSAAGGSSGGGAAAETIMSLTSEALQEIFTHLGQQQSYCREVLPLVCKRFRDVLQQPSSVWESLHIDFLHKGLAVVLPGLRQGAEGDAGELADGSNRRLLHSAVERWVQPRAAAVKRLVLSFSARDASHSFPKNGAGLRRLLRLLAPTLQELCVAHCSDVFHARSFADVAMLQNLETLAVTFQTGRVTPADLAPLERLRKLKALTLAASRQAEEGGLHCLPGFPDTLLKLRGLTSLAVCSLGVTNLPAGLTKLKSLACLDVSGCPISFLPSNLWRLAGLRHVRLNGTSLMVGLMHSWEPLGKLPALESVELRDTKAVGLPPVLPGLSALTSLDLSDNPFDALGGLPDGLQALSTLPNLQRLMLRCCQLPSVPADVCLLSRLTHLDVSRNQLVELPPALSALGALRELVAEGNCFPRIPQVLAELPALEVADLSFNIYMEAALSLRPLLESGGLARLRRLDLRKMLGVWKQSSIRWLRELVEVLQARHAAAGGSPGSAPTVEWD
ncbi:hypothetical protein ABPG75_002522 [Micractinium tetrahymenae]